MDGNNFDQDLNNNVTPPNPLMAGPVPEPEVPVNFAQQPAAPEVPANPVQQPAVPEMPMNPVQQTTPEMPASSMNPMEPVAPEGPMEPVMPANPMEPAVPETPSQMAKPKKNNKMTIILMAIMGVLLVAVVVVMVMMNLPQNGSGNNGGGNSESGSVSDDTDDDEPEDEPVENTELAAGTVTVMVDGQEVTYSAAYLVDGIEATISSGVYESALENQAVFVVANGGSLKIQGDVQINKTGNASTESANGFYGLNSAIVVVGEGSSVTVDGATVTTNGSSAGAVVAVEGGKMDVSNATLTTDGANSPLVYSAGTVTVSDSTGAANGAQIAVLEGEHSLTFDGCDFTTNGIGGHNNIDNAAIMIYRTVSEDSEQKASEFTATGSTLTVNPSSSVYTTAPLFFVTNTLADVKLTDTTASFYDAGYFMIATGTEMWGTAGMNGATVTLETSGFDTTNLEIALDETSAVINGSEGK